jgi:hypothetical protein
MKDNKIYIQLQQKTNFQVSTQQKDFVKKKKLNRKIVNTNISNFLVHYFFSLCTLSSRKGDHTVFPNYKLDDT